MRVIKNVKLLRNNQIIENKAILYNSQIIDIVDEANIGPAHLYENILDFGGLYLAPGFIDIHIHGCSSHDVMDQSQDNIDLIGENLARTGVTSFLPTTMTQSLEAIENALIKIKHRMKKTEGVNVLGCHLEGPFINKTFKGAHYKKYILPPQKELIEKYSDVIKIVTLAPELDGNLELLDKCVEKGIIVSIGHTGTSFEKASEAIARGAKSFTHTFNAMTPLKHRDPGAIGAAMLSDVSCELIADNIHLHPAILKLMVKIKGHQGIILVTDAMRACLMCDGTYELGGQKVIVSNREARLEDGTLAGSVLTMNVALKNTIKASELPLAYAIDMLTLNPAKLLGIVSQKGIIDTGFDSDFVVFDDNINIKCTIAGGKTVYMS